MAEQQSTIALNIALFALLSFTLHFQAQGEGTVAGAWGPAASAGGEAGTAEFVLLEPIAERRPAATVGAVNATDSDALTTELTCLQCHCCLDNTNPQVCLTTCCYQRISGHLQVVSCGCNHCVPPPAPHNHRPPLRTN